MSETRPASQSKAQKITLITLGVLALGTVFLLPTFVSEPWLTSKDLERMEEPAPPPEAIAPSTAAELKRYRQESQTVLAEIVIKRDRLRERGVERWAAADFHNALGKVEVGDEQYSYGNYDRSLAYYREARSQLAQLETSGQQKLSQAKSEALAAIDALNLNVARAASELAQAIAPDDPEVGALAARVETLEDVSTRIEAGDHALERDRFEQARQEYRAALNLDPAHPRAAKGLALAQREITGGAFRRQMSRGFAALENGEYEAARAAFRRAGEIDPRNPAVGQALAQVENIESRGQVNDRLAQALELEATEQWAEAVALYEQLLAEDESLADVKARLLPARIRADLDARISRYIEEPLLLSTKSEYDKAQVTLQDAKGIGNAGPLLRQQAAQLEQIVARANSPVNVVFRSDNQTHVVLYRVAELGRFEQTSLRLRPGKYVAAGTRKGFRDVRVEFTITGEPLENPIVVRCEEPIG